MSTEVNKIDTDMTHADPSFKGIEHRATYSSLTIYEDYLAICTGRNGRSKAILLSILEQWTSELPEGEYVTRSYREFEQAIYGLCSFNTIARCLTELEAEKLIERRASGTKGSSAYEYRLCTGVIQKRLDALPERNYISRKGSRSSLRMSAFALYPTLEIFRGQCAYCQIAQATVWDHIIPTSQGGKTIIGNLVPACHYCNGSKGDTDVLVWLQAQNIRSGFALEQMIAALYGNAVNVRGVKDQ